MNIRKPWCIILQFFNTFKFSIKIVGQLSSKLAESVLFVIISGSWLFSQLSNFLIDFYPLKTQNYSAPKSLRLQLIYYCCIMWIIFKRVYAFVHFWMKQLKLNALMETLSIARTDFCPISFLQGYYYYLYRFYRGPGSWHKYFNAVWNNRVNNKHKPVETWWWWGYGRNSKGLVWWLYYDHHVSSVYNYISEHKSQNI